MKHIFTALAAAIILFSAAAQAQTAWPTKPVRIVVTQAAGNATDIIARTITERLTQSTGQQFIIENRPGGANVIGAQSVARATPDGYTFMFATGAVFTTNPFTMKALPYDPVKDFDMVSLVARGPFMIVAHASLPANNLAEVLALAKKEPGKLNMATDQPRNYTGLVASWVMKASGADIVTVPYVNMPQGIQDLLANRVQLSILALPAAGPHLAAGTIKPIAITSAQSIPGYEKLRPIADQIPGFDISGWFAFVAPAGTPKDVITKFNAETGKILDDAVFKKRLEEMGFFSFGSHTIGKADEFLKADIAAWKKVVDGLEITPQ
jgi:tripartite-type tricarboxylate transporter receptor subunit TctC